MTAGILLMVIASILKFLWLYLLNAANDNDLITSSAAKIVRLKDRIKIEQYKKTVLLHNQDTLSSKPLLTEQASKLQKQKKLIFKLEHSLELMARDRYANTNPIILAGFALLRILRIDKKNLYYSRLIEAVSEIYGSTNSAVITKSLLAESLANLLVGISGVLILSTIVMETGTPSKGLWTAFLGVLLIITVVYLPYDNLFSRVKKRKRALLRSFPQVVTKLTLLVNAGIDLTQAWRVTAFSGYQQLYLEMQGVCRALDNGITLKAAFQDFINSCRVRPIAEFVLAIDQAHTQGNSEISRLLLELVKVVGEERRHRAKRLAELANSKLLLPLMMVFTGIMMLVIVPILFNLGV